MFLPAQEPRVGPCGDARIHWPLMKHGHSASRGIEPSDDLFHGEILRVGAGLVGVGRREDRNHFRCNQ